MRILSNLSVSGLLGLNSVADANTDTDKFLVLDSSGIVRYRTGAELYSDIGAGVAAYTSVLQHTVKAGVALTKGQAVYVTSADGTNMIVGKASNVSEATSSKTLGLVVQNLALNAQGFVITEGLLAGLDTSTAVAGDPVWLGTDGNLIFGLANKPYAPAHLVFIGIVTRVQQNNGEIFVKVQNGFELQELHNVQITSTPSDNTVLAYEASTSLYKMKSIPTLLGYTPADAARTLTINGTTYDLSANRTWSVGTVTGSGSMGYVPKWATSSGLTNGMMYDAGTAVLIGTQTASSGKFMVYSTSPDNHYQAVGSGPSFRFADTITSPNYTGIIALVTSSNQFITGAAAGDMVLANNTTSAIGSFIFGTGATERMRISPTGNVSINNTNNTYRFDVTGTVRFTGQLRLESTITNGTYTYTLPGATGTLALVGGAGVGTVTSIATTGPITGGTITSTGTIGITQSGAASDGYLSSTDWNTFNNKQGALTLTTTGTSGAATLVGNTLNIPNYAPDLSGYVPTSRTLTINGTAFDLSANRSWSVGTVTSVGLSSATSGVTIGSTPITTSGTITLAIATASGSQQGLLSSTDWNTFNNKQNALTNPVTGTGTTNYLPKFTGTSTIGNSAVTDNGTITTSLQDFYVTKGNALLSVTSTNTGGFSVLRMQSSTIADLWFGRESSTSGIFGLTASSSVIYSEGAFPFHLWLNGATRLTMSTSGNLGLGVTPSAWNSGTKALQVNNASIYGGSNYGFFGSNIVWTNSGDQYITNGFATLYGQLSGEHRFYTAPSGTAGNAISFTQAMTLDANGRLGIGTTSPSTILHLVQSSGPTIRLVRTSNRFDITADNDFMELNARDASTYMTFKTADTERMRITSGGLVGIGTSSPTTFLDINSGANPPIIKLTSSAVGQIPFSIRANIPGFSNSGFSIYDETAAASRLVISSTGNVGIGTTSPDEILRVNGSSSGTSRIRLYNQGSEVGVFGSKLGYFGSGAANDLLIYSQLDTTIGAASNVLFTSGGATERMRITSGGLVGIGTSSPTGRLNVITSGTGFAPSATGAIGGSQNSRSHFQGGEPGIMLSSDISPTTGVQTGSQAYQLGLQIGFYAVNDVRNQIYYGNGPLTFVYSGNQGVSISEYMRITTGGNVGIGTTSPDANSRLDVNGQAFVARLAVYNDNGTPSLGTSPLLYSPASGTLAISTASAERMRITSGGNVGIGTTSPTSGISSTETTLQIQNGNVAALALNNSASRKYTIYSGVGGQLGFYDVTGGAERITLSSSGNVGIGTTSPDRPLDIYSANTVGIARIRANNANGAAITIQNDENSQSISMYAVGSSGFGIGGWAGNAVLESITGVVYSAYNGNHIFQTGVSGRTERMRITSAGEVLVNATTTTQSAKFYVNGTAAFGSVYVGALGTGLVYSNGGTLTSTNPSDYRLKNTIKPLSYGLNEILQLNPKTFYYNDDVNKERLKYGFIAQEVKGIMPELARKLNAETDYLGLETEGIWVTLINAIKEQQAQINELKSQLNK